MSNFKKLISILLCVMMLASVLASCDTAVPGPQGEQGIQGEKGEKGDTGAQGAQGEKGDKGDTGAQGAQGEKGDKGDTGAQGAQGEKGDKGDKGDTGAQGTQGEKGDKGDKGDTGAQGAQGDKGDKGDKGDTGAQGAQGEKGDKGDKGDTGETIEKVEFNAEGKLVITLTDGTVLDPVELPEKEVHAHTYGELIDFGDNRKLECDERIYYSVCSTCYEIKWSHGKESDHKFNTQYSVDGYYHWFNCTKCSAKTEYAEHTLDDDGYCSVCDQALTASSGIEYAVSADGTYAEVIDYTGTARKIMIANTYEGVPVTVIANGVFRRKNIISVVIPDGVTSIGEAAFYGCTELTSVTIPDSVTSIGDFAFNGCTGLTSITIPDSVTSIGIYAFFGCTGLTSITIPNSVTQIGDSAFSNCYSIQEKENGVTYVDKWAIDFDDSVVTLILREDTLGIASSAFSYLTKLRSITLPNTLKYIDKRAFYECTGLTSITIPDSVTSIGEFAFAYCTGLTSITIPDSVNRIGSHAFNVCRELTSIVFEDTTTWYITTDSSYFEGTSISVTNASTNATYFKSTYYNYYWYKN